MKKLLKLFPTLKILRLHSKRVFSFSRNYFSVSFLHLMDFYLESFKKTNLKLKPQLFIAEICSGLHFQYCQQNVLVSPSSKILIGFVCASLTTSVITGNLYILHKNLRRDSSQSEGLLPTPPPIFSWHILQLCTTLAKFSSDL